MVYPDNICNGSDSAMAMATAPAAAIAVLLTGRLVGSSYFGYVVVKLSSNNF
jgi:hypothetical protein